MDEMKKKYRNAYKKWTESEEYNLEDMWMNPQDYGFGEKILPKSEMITALAAHFERNEGAIYSKLSHMGLEKEWNFIKKRELKSKPTSNADINDKDADFWYTRGNRLLNLTSNKTYGDSTMSKEPFHCFQKAIEKDPTFMKAHLAMAVGHYNAERYWEALDVIKSAIELDRYFADFWYLRALISERLNQYQDVADCYLFVCDLGKLSKEDNDYMMQKYVQAKQKLNQSK